MPKLTARWRWRRRIAVALVTLLVVVLGLLLTGGVETFEQAEVERAVARAYLTYAHQKAVSADCAHASENEDGSEEWWCDVQANDPLGADPCTADLIRGQDGALTARITFCINVDG